MATVTSPNWAITNVSANQGSAEVPINTFVDGVLDMSTGFRCKSATTSAEPGSPTNGDCYILPAVIAGSNWDPLANDANAKKVAYYYNGWIFYPVPVREGFHAWVDDTQGVIRYDITLAAWTYFWRTAVSDALTAAGTTQGGALALTTEYNRVTVVTGANKGVKLPAALSGMRVVVFNADGADPLDVYPASGDAINNLGTDVAYVLAAGVTGLFCAFNTTNWGALS
jgi:Protein of unknown function (DUF2793)